MKSSIGRIVHYTAKGGSASGKYKAGDCLAAIITADPEPLHTSLAVLTPTGMFFNERVKRSDDKLPGTWHEPEGVGDLYG